MSDPRFQRLYEPILEQIKERSAVAEGAFIDKDVYCIYLATLWTNVAMDPSEGGIEESDLEGLHDYLNEEIAAVLGAGRGLPDCFRFVRSPAGEQAMSRLRVPPMHRDLMLYFAVMILDPEGHKALMQRARDEQASKRRR